MRRNHQELHAQKSILTFTTDYVCYVVCRVMNVVCHEIINCLTGKRDPEYLPIIMILLTNISNIL